MTPEQVMRTRDLLLARAEINSFLLGKYNEEGSMKVFEPDDAVMSEISGSHVVYVSMVEASIYNPDSDEMDEYNRPFAVYLPRDVVEEALARQQGYIEQELIELGVDLTQEFHGDVDSGQPAAPAAASDTLNTAGASDTLQEKDQNS